MNRKGDTRFATLTNIRRGEQARLDIMRILAQHYRLEGYGASYRQIAVELGHRPAWVGAHMPRLVTWGYVRGTANGMSGWLLTGKYPLREHFTVVLEDIDRAQLEWELYLGTPRNSYREQVSPP